MPDGSPKRPPTRPLGSRYWRLWSASAISNLGDGVNAAALPLLAASLTRDPRLVAGMAVAAFLPWLIFSLPAGAIVDRLDRRKVMYRVDLVRAVLVAAIAVLAATHVATIWMLYILAFALGVNETLFDNAAQSILPSLVDDDQLEVANGRQYSAEVVANSFVGPPIGGLLFAVAVSLPFWLDSGSFVVAALLVASLAGTFRAAPSPNAVAGERPSLRADIAEGVRWLRANRLLRTLALLLGTMNFASNLSMAVFVLFAQEILGLDAQGFGLLLAAMAFGAVLGGLFGPRIAAKLGPGRALVIAIAGIGFSEAAVGLLSSAWAVAPLFWVSGLFSTVWNIITVSLRQSMVPDHLLGRVNSVYRFLGWGSIPLGALAGGFLAEWLGLRAPFLIGGAIYVVALLLAWPRITTSAIEGAKATAQAARAGYATPLTPAPPSIT